MKLLILTAPKGHQDTVAAVLEQHAVHPVWWESSADHEELFSVRFMSGGSNDQKLLDDLERVIGSSESASIHTVRVDSTFPRRLSLTTPTRLSRDELTLIAEQGAQNGPVFLLLVALSTVVAAIGLLQDNVAVIIGAMVIAPLLAPNISAALSIALGQFQLARDATSTLMSGVGLAFAIAFVIGLIWPDKIAGPELLGRTVVGIDSSVLAFASGMAGVLSLTSGVPAVLVGVMVAVALLPPLVTSAILLSWYDIQSGINALMLFIINIAAINLSAHITLYFNAVRPRTLVLSSKASRNSLVSSVTWLIVLIVITGLAVQRFLPVSW